MFALCVCLWVYIIVCKIVCATQSIRKQRSRNQYYSSRVSGGIVSVASTNCEAIKLLLLFRFKNQPRCKREKAITLTKLLLLLDDSIECQKPQRLKRSCLLASQRSFSLLRVLVEPNQISSCRVAPPLNDVFVPFARLLLNGVAPSRYIAFKIDRRSRNRLVLQDRISRF